MKLFVFYDADGKCHRSNYTKSIQGLKEALKL